VRKLWLKFQVSSTAGSAQKKVAFFFRHTIFFVDLTRIYVWKIIFKYSKKGVSFEFEIFRTPDLRVKFEFNDNILY